MKNHHELKGIRGIATCFGHFGKPFNDLKNEYGVKKGESLRDYLTADQLREVEHLEMLISSLIGLGMGYNEIQNFVNEKYNPTLQIGA